jgi:iron complex transport system ATP-binding protein
VALGRIARGVDLQQATITAAALQRAEAAHLLGRRFDTLSGGEQARVMLARVFAQLWDSPPGWLLVDEPLAALDPGLQLALTEALLGYCHERGHALVAVLHDINLALAAFQRLWLVRAGEIVADLPSNAAAVPALEQLYGVGLHTVQDDDGRPAVLLRRRPAAAAPRAAAAGVSLA